MTDLQCAVGVAQLKKYDQIEKIKTNNYNLYREQLEQLEQVEFVKLEDYSNFVPFRVNLKVKRQHELIQFLEKNNIQTRGFFYPMHRQPCFSYLGYKEEEFAVSNKLNQVGLSLPVFCDLTHGQINYICEKIKEFYKK